MKKKLVDIKFGLKTVLHFKFYSILQFWVVFYAKTDLPQWYHHDIIVWPKAVAEKCNTFI